MREEEKAASRRALPPGRTFEQLKNHYEVEKVIALKLKRADREERKAIYRTMYDELFRQVPDHPRLTKRTDKRRTALAKASKMRLVGRHVSPSTTFAEFGPGDCSFSMEVAELAHAVYAVDISDQRANGVSAPPNFHLIVYDGYHLDIKDESIDLVFSDKLIEHLHPDDTEDHLRTVRRILKKGGEYLFRTPHSYSGPHDISAFFSDEPEGFHLKEWTFTELVELLERVGFSSWNGYLSVKGRIARAPMPVITDLERAIGMTNGRLRKAIGRRVLPHVIVSAVR